MKQCRIPAQHGIQAHLPENRLLRHGGTGHGHQVRLRRQNWICLTIDGSGGGTGMSPWNMMQSWGVPSINLHAKAYEYASILAAKGQKVVDMSFAGGFALEDSIFKGLALGAPYTKMVCMGRAVMIPGFLGANIEGALHPERREELMRQLGQTAQDSQRDR